jgi:hypothetical protein
MKKLTKSYIVGGLVGLVGLLNSCGGGNPDVPPIVDIVDPVVVEHSLDDEAGQELTQSRDMNYDFKVVGMDNMSGTLELELKVNNGGTYRTTLNKYDGKFEFNTQIAKSNFTTLGNYEGVKSQVKLTDIAQNSTTDERVWKKSLSEAKAREVMREAYEEDIAEFIYEDIPAVINGTEYISDIRGQFRGNSGSAYNLLSENNTLSDKIDTSQIPNNKLVFEMNGLKMYQMDRNNDLLAVIDKTTDTTELKNLQEKAIQELKNYYNDF